MRASSPVALLAMKVLCGLVLFALTAAGTASGQGSVVSWGWTPPGGYPGDNRDFVAVKCEEGCSPIGSFAHAWPLTAQGQVIWWDFNFVNQQGWTNNTGVVADLDSVVAIASSGCHSGAALRQDGSVFVLSGMRYALPPRAKPRLHRRRRGLHSWVSPEARWIHCGLGR